MLKVPHSHNEPMEPPMQEPPMPPAANEPMESPMDEPMGDQMMDNEMDGEMNDPKKSIQQLVGKLSQELRTYNDNQEGQDTDLNKYVAGMIIPQATKVMTDDDKNEVINKIKKGSTDDMTPENGNMQDDEPIVNEVINSLVNDKKDTRFEKHITNQEVKSRSNPFKTNR